MMRANSSQCFLVISVVFLVIKFAEVLVSEDPVATAPRRHQLRSWFRAYFPKTSKSNTITESHSGLYVQYELLAKLFRVQLYSFQKKMYYCCSF